MGITAFGSLERGIDRIYKINIGLRFSKFGFVGENTCGKCHIVKPWMGKNRESRHCIQKRALNN